MKSQALFQLMYPLLLVVIVSITMAAHYMMEPMVQFPILYLLPISLAMTMPLLHSCFRLIVPEVWSHPGWLLNALIQMTVLILFVYYVGQTTLHRRVLQRDVRVLTGIIGICSFCKKIRSETNDWVKLEPYLSDHLEITFLVITDSVEPVPHRS